MEMTQTAMRRGDLSLLDHPVARELLAATIPARLAYTGLDGAPRVVPTLFHWTGEEILVFSWPDDYKVAALWTNPQAALTIDTSEAPFRVLSLRCDADITITEGPPPEMPQCFTRYFGLEGARAQLNQMTQMSPTMARIALRPTWADVIDFETRLPAGMERKLAARP